jgi:hypothetical protein
MPQTRVQGQPAGPIDRLLRPCPAHHPCTLSPRSAADGLPLPVHSPPLAARTAPLACSPRRCALLGAGAAGGPQLLALPVAGQRQTAHVCGDWARQHVHVGGAARRILSARGGAWACPVGAGGSLHLHPKALAPAPPPLPPRCQFPFDLDRPPRPGTTKALSTYDYVLLNSEYTDRCVCVSVCVWRGGGGARAHAGGRGGGGARARARWRSGKRERGEAKAAWALPLGTGLQRSDCPPSGQSHSLDQLSCPLPPSCQVVQPLHRSAHRECTARVERRALGGRAAPAGGGAPLAACHVQRTPPRRGGHATAAPCGLPCSAPGC